MKALYEQAQDAANALRVLAHPDRLMVLCQLCESEASVSQLLESSRLSQSAFSQHLQVLRAAGMVETRKEAQTVYYRVDNEKVRSLMAAIQGAWCGDFKASTKNE